MYILQQHEGKMITRVTGLDAGSDEIVVWFHDGQRVEFWHSQDCCESVYVNDVDGDSTDMVGAYLHSIEESVNPDDAPEHGSWDSHTWTFYRFFTSKGVVVVRWLGESNGYYSESVSFKTYQ